MGVDARYYLRFATDDAAKTALDGLGVAPYQSAIPGTMPLYKITNPGTGTMELTQCFEDHTVVVAYTLSRFLSQSSFLDTPETWTVSPRDVACGRSVLADLNFLLAIPHLSGADLFYGNDFEEPTDVHTPVDKEFLVSLRELATTNHTSLF